MEPITFKAVEDGWIAVGKWPDGSSRQVGQITHRNCETIALEVEAMYQLAGIGSELLKRAEDDMRAKGCTEAFVYAGRTSPNTPHPREFYGKKGYRPVRRLYFLWSPNSLRKKLY
jgi:GNAT superfamily N-acetyltransferase